MSKFVCRVDDCAQPATHDAVIWIHGVNVAPELVYLCDRHAGAFCSAEPLPEAIKKRSPASGD